MSDIDISFDVNGAKKVEKALNDAIESGTKKARDHLLDVGKDSAKGIIVSNDLVWTTELYRSIKTVSHSSKDSYSGMVLADSRHAAPIEFGAEYDTEGPPLTSIMPWVKANLSDWSFDFDPRHFDVEPDRNYPEPDIEKIKEDQGRNLFIPEPEDSGPLRDEVVNNLDEGTEVNARVQSTIKTGNIRISLNTEFDREYILRLDEGGEVTITPDDIVSFDGQGSTFDDLDVGDFVSDGKGIYEITKKEDGGTPGIRVEGLKGGTDLLDPSEVTLISKGGDTSLSPNEVGPLGKIDEEQFFNGQEIKFRPQEYNEPISATVAKNVLRDEEKFPVTTEDGRQVVINRNQITFFEGQGESQADILIGDIVSDGYNFGYVFNKIDSSSKVDFVAFNDIGKVKRVPSSKVKIVEEDRDFEAISSSFTKNKHRIEAGSVIDVTYTSTQSGNEITKRFNVGGSRLLQMNEGEGRFSVTYYLQNDDGFAMLTRIMEEDGTPITTTLRGFETSPTRLDKSTRKLSKLDINVERVSDGSIPDQSDSFSLKPGVKKAIVPRTVATGDFQKGDIMFIGGSPYRVFDSDGRGVTVGWGDKPNKYLFYANDGYVNLVSLNEDGSVPSNFFEKSYEYSSGVKALRPEEGNPFLGIHLKQEGGTETSYPITENQLDRLTDFTTDFSIISGEDIDKYIGGHVIVRDRSGYLSVRKADKSLEGTGFLLRHKDGTTTEHDWYVPTSSKESDVQLIAVAKEPGDTPDLVESPTESNEQIEELSQAVAFNLADAAETIGTENDDDGLVMELDRADPDALAHFSTLYDPENRDDDLNLERELQRVYAQYAVDLFQKANQYSSPSEGSKFPLDEAKELLQIAKDSEDLPDPIFKLDDGVSGFSSNRVFDPSGYSYDPDERYPDVRLPDGNVAEYLSTKGYAPDDTFYGEEESFDFENSFIGQRVEVYDGNRNEFVTTVVTKDGDDDFILRLQDDFSQRITSIRDSDKVVASSRDRRTNDEIIDELNDALLEKADTSELDKDLSKETIKETFTRLYKEGEAEKIQQLAYNINKFEDVVKNPNKNENRVMGYLQQEGDDPFDVTDIRFGINEKAVGNQPVAKETLNHEIQHGYQALDGHHLDGSDPHLKTDEFEDNDVVTFNYLDVGPKTGDPDATYPYAPAYNLMMGPENHPRESIFDVWNQDVQDRVKNGLNGKAGLATYESTNAGDLWFSGDRPSVGDYIRTEGVDGNGTQYFRVKEIDDDVDGIVFVTMADERNKERQVSIYDDGSFPDGQMTGYAPSSSVDTGYDLYHDPEQNPTLAYREVVSRAWYRGALGSEEDVNSGMGREKAIKKWGVKDNGYSLTNSLEMEAVTKEVFTTKAINPFGGSDKPFSDVVDEFVKYHPDLIYAYIVWYDGSVSPTFLQQLERSTGTDSLEDALKELKP